MELICKKMVKTNVCVTLCYICSCLPSFDKQEMDVCSHPASVQRNDSGGHHFRKDLYVYSV